MKLRDIMKNDSKKEKFDIYDEVSVFSDKTNLDINPVVSKKKISLPLIFFIASIFLVIITFIIVLKIKQNKTDLPSEKPINQPVVDLDPENVEKTKLDELREDIEKANPSKKEISYPNVNNLYKI